MCSSDLSAQNALYHITQSVLRLIAPVLSFTAEEAWRLFQPGDDTVFAHTYYRLPEVSGAEALLGKWRALRQIRSEVHKLLENHRSAGRIGSSLQAEVEIVASGEKLKLLKGLGDDLRFVLITSRATVARAASEADEAIILCRARTRNASAAGTGART